jgi:hypothetical protein
VLGSVVAARYGYPSWARPSLCPRPDALSSLPDRLSAVRSLVYADTARIDVGIPSPAVLALSGRGHAELRLLGILRSWRFEYGAKAALLWIDKDVRRVRNITNLREVRQMNGGKGIYVGGTLISILISLALYATGRRESAIFVGLWAPTILNLGQSLLEED